MFEFRFEVRIFEVGMLEVGMFEFRFEDEMFKVMIFEVIYSCSSVWSDSSVNNALNFSSL